jgi:hypothetical protein
MNGKLKTFLAIVSKKGKMRIAELLPERRELS